MANHKHNKYIKQELKKINTRKKTKQRWLEYLGGGCLQTDSRNHFININGKVEYANDIQKKR
jgi:hypothetical protein